MAQGIFNLKQVNQAIRQDAWTGIYAPKFVECLVVAGGGGGQTGGGGGAGGFLTGIVPVTAGASYTVTVGGGGSNGGGGAAVQGVTGTSSVFGSITATGGGGGASYNGTTTGKDGGSGGGGYDKSPGGQGTANQGNAGASGNVVTTASGGGGGAGSMGLNPLPANGTIGTANSGGGGGAGVASAISGAIMTYAGGGGGGASSDATLRSNGGIGGGGLGCIGGDALNTTGTVNTGGGGGGGFYVNSDGKAGGSGIVIVRYPGSVQFYTGGTVNYANGYIVHTFYANGTLAPTTPTQYSNTYQISRSLRFNSADSPSLTRTPSTAGNRRTWTYSLWFKRSGIGVEGSLLDAGRGNTPWTGFYVSTGDGVGPLLGSLAFAVTAGTQPGTHTTATFRDPSAWYHIVLAVDTTQSNTTDRAKIYVNNVLQPILYANYPSLNYETYVNSTSIHSIGAVGNAGGGHQNGYMTDIHLIDGQALTPSSFGEYDVNTGVWIPRAYGGSYGTNGFKLNFSDNSNVTAATLGADSSGNGNNWTPNNFSVSAGAGNDSYVDTPTQYGTDTGVGGEVRGNYCTWNPLVKPYGTNTYTNANLDVVPNGNWNAVVGTIGITTGKWYWEIISAIQDVFIGIQPIGQDYTVINPQNFNGVFVCDDNQKLIDGTRTAYTATGHGAGVVVGVAVDLDAGSITFYKNGVSQGAINFASSLTYGKTVLPTIIPYYAGYVFSANFGQRAFVYTAPSGFKAICTTNLPTPTIGATATTRANKFFNPVTYTGNADLQPITVGFQPDWVWLKSRSVNRNHRLMDTVRGINNVLSSDLTTAEYAGSALSSINSSGFTLNNTDNQNVSSETYVAWNWRASNATAVTNTSGSLTSSVSANPTAGFSIVTYTGTGGSGTTTVGHGLGIAPSMVIIKRRDGAANWATYHTGLISTSYYLFLNLNNAQANYGSTFISPSSSTLTIDAGSSLLNASGGTYVSYCFAPIAGYSAFGTYVGNASTDGPFIYTGFRPAYVMMKDSTSLSDWYVFDIARNPYNVTEANIYPNDSAAETTFSTRYFDIVSNGFKFRTTAGPNTNGQTFIFLAFASHPFKYSLAR